jgi:hypothetical protein
MPPLQSHLWVYFWTEFHSTFSSTVLSENLYIVQCTLVQFTVMVTEPPMVFLLSHLSKMYGTGTALLCFIFFKFERLWILV